VTRFFSTIQCGSSGAAESPAWMLGSGLLQVCNTSFRFGKVRFPEADAAIATIASWISERLA
jgi:hypothetical protein